MNEHEAQRIAASVHELRPDWPVSSLMTLIRKSLIQRPRRDVMVAFAWVACETGTSSPGRVLEAGPWWRAAGVEGMTTFGPPRADEACLLCGKYLAACQCDETAPTRQLPGPNPRNHEHAEQARAALRGAKGDCDG